ncbi:MAG: hypothetical protein LRZ85_09890 [Alphaproteobacteria bacterium]|nr:hypothetical protein [Alphaproteobacteria bacterium]MCD8525762.1 hypothetical protein [Alphaproteobacteria bacterium]MCD8571142.1 hypothetical protein [Alphaproteobacteria bacterium]
MPGFGSGPGRFDHLLDTDNPLPMDKDAAKAKAFFAAVAKAGIMQDVDSTVLEFCNYDYDKAAELMGIKLEIE